MHFLKFSEFKDKYLCNDIENIFQNERRSHSVTEKFFVKQLKYTQTMIINEACAELVINRHLGEHHPDWFIIPLAWTYSDDAVYMVFPRGKALFDMLLNNEPIDVDQLYNDLREGIARLRGLNIAHNDIKPDNVVYHEGRFKLIDFGLAVITIDGHIPPADAFALLYRDPIYCPIRYNPISVELYALGRTLEDILKIINNNDNEKLGLSTFTYYKPQADSKWQPLLEQLICKKQPDICPILPSKATVARSFDTDKYEACMKQLNALEDYAIGNIQVITHLIKQYVSYNGSLDPSIVVKAAINIAYYLSVCSPFPLWHDEFDHDTFAFLADVNCDVFFSYKDVNYTPEVKYYHYNEYTPKLIRNLDDYDQEDKDYLYLEYLYFLTLDTDKLTSEDKQLIKRKFPPRIVSMLLPEVASSDT